MSRSYCFFSAQYLPTVGGVERYTYELAKELIARGDRVTVVASRIGNMPERETTAEGIRVVRLPVLPLMNGRFPVLYPTRTRARLTAELQKDHFDLVVINTRFYPHSLYGAKFAAKIGCPCIVIEHGSAHLTLASGLLDRLGQWYEHGLTALLKRRCKRFYGVSAGCCDWLTHFHIQAQGLLPNAVNFDEIARIREAAVPHFRRDAGIAPETPVIVYTGRLVPEKGVPALMEAVGRIAGERPVHLLLAGDGPLLAEARVAGSFVTALGSLPFEEVIALLSESDIFCLPSRSEGFCSSYLEAVACGCYGVGTRVGVLAEVLADSGFGTLLPDHTAQSVYDGLQKALCRTDRADCARRAFAHCRQTYTFAETADRLGAVCDAL